MIEKSDEIKLLFKSQAISLKLCIKSFLHNQQSQFCLKYRFLPNLFLPIFLIYFFLLFFFFFPQILFSICVAAESEHSLFATHFLQLCNQLLVLHSQILSTILSKHFRSTNFYFQELTVRKNKSIKYHSTKECFLLWYLTMVKCTCCIITAEKKAKEAV